MRKSPLAKLALYVVAAVAVIAGAYWQQAADKTEKRSAVESRYDLRAIADAEEREIVRETLQLVDRGGPFPYRQDGRTFDNRERRLPEAPRGYYREYTVKTPGVRWRGARRIVQGTSGETYYTRDHYRTFVRVSR